MTAENQDFLHLTDVLADLNKALLEKDCGSPCYAPSTAYGYARSGQIPTKRKGRAYFVRRSDIPLIAKKLPLGTRSSHSAMQKKLPAREFWIVGNYVFSDGNEAKRIHSKALPGTKIIHVREVLPGEGA